jgi:hypothetical protein
VQSMQLPTTRGFVDPISSATFQLFCGEMLKR